MDAGSFWESEPHLKGTAELITVFTGGLEICAGGQRLAVEAGESVRFQADTVHSYRNTGDGGAVLQMILYHP